MAKKASTAGYHSSLASVSEGSDALELGILGLPSHPPVVQDVCDGRCRRGHQISVHSCVCRLHAWRRSSCWWIVQVLQLHQAQGLLSKITRKQKKEVKNPTYGRHCDICTENCADVIRFWVGMHVNRKIYRSYRIGVAFNIWYISPAAERTGGLR